MPLKPDLINVAKGVITGDFRIPTNKDEILIAGAGVAGTAVGGTIGGFAAKKAAEILLGGDKVDIHHLTNSDSGMMMVASQFKKLKGKTKFDPFTVVTIPTSYSWLPMSQSIVANYAFDWTQAEGTDVGDKGGIGSAIEIGGSVINDAISGGRTGATLRSTSGLAPDYHMKVLFQGAGFRTFQWPLTFQPNNLKDAQGIQAWIQNVKVLAAPESGAVYWSNPNLFDITFFKAGTQQMFRTKDLALTNLEVNYTPNNIWSQHTNGFPTAISVNLSFIETVRLSQQNIENFGL